MFAYLLRNLSAWVSFWGVCTNITRCCVAGNIYFSWQFLTDMRKCCCAYCGPCPPEIDKPKDFDMTSPCSFWVFLTLVPRKGETDNPRLRIFWAAFARLAGHNGWSLSPTGVWDSGSGGLLGPSQDLATNATFPPAAVPSSCITRK